MIRPLPGGHTLAYNAHDDRWRLYDRRWNVVWDTQSWQKGRKLPEGGWKLCEDEVLKVATLVALESVEQRRVRREARFRYKLPIKLEPARVRKPSTSRRIRARRIVEALCKRDPAFFARALGVPTGLSSAVSEFTRQAQQRFGGDSSSWRPHFSLAVHMAAGRAVV
ncbi:MAG: hypothetical protein AB7S38_28895 [Vulcanimicrobiota bacterium]